MGDGNRGSDQDDLPQRRGGLCCPRAAAAAAAAAAVGCLHAVVAGATGACYNLSVVPTGGIGNNGIRRHRRLGGSWQCQGCVGQLASLADQPGWQQPRVRGKRAALAGRSVDRGRLLVGSGILQSPQLLSAASRLSAAQHNSAAADAQATGRTLLIVSIMSVCLLVAPYCPR